MANGNPDQDTKTLPPIPYRELIEAELARYRALLEQAVGQANHAQGAIAALERVLAANYSPVESIPFAQPPANPEPKKEGE